MLIYFIYLFVITFLMTAILLHPDVSVAGATSGLLMWFNSVLPSLFPFMTLTGLLIRLEITKHLSLLFRRKDAAQRNRCSFLFAALIGLLCGYPMGLKTVADLKTSKQLTKRQALLLISFANQPGPMFILGYALPTCDPESKHSLIFLLAFYSSVLLTALFFATWQRIFERKHQQQADTPVVSKELPAMKPTFFRAFEDTILSSMITLTKIGGYMMLFSMITALLKASISAHKEMIIVFSGLMEMTSGISETMFFPFDVKPYFVLGFISFGGLCVTAQSFSLGELERKEQLRYLAAKSLQTILSLLIFYLLTRTFTG